MSDSGSANASNGDEPTPTPAPAPTSVPSTTVQLAMTSGDAASEAIAPPSDDSGFDDIKKAAQFYYRNINATAETWDSIQSEIMESLRVYPQGVPDQKRFGRTTGSIQGVQYFLYAIAGCEVVRRLRNSTTEVQAAMFFSELIRHARNMEKREGLFAPRRKYSGFKPLMNENSVTHQYPGQSPVPWFRYLFVTSSQLHPKDPKSLFTRQFKEYCKGCLQNKYLPAWNLLNPGGPVHNPAKRQQQLNRTHAEVWKRTQPDHWQKYQESPEYKSLKDPYNIPEAAYIKATAWLAFEWLGPAADPKTQEPMLCGSGRKIRPRVDPMAHGHSKKRRVAMDNAPVPAPEGTEVAQPQDPRVELLKKFQVWQIAYCRDMVRVVHHSVAPRDIPDMQTMVGRASTVTGPDIYLNALEKIRPGCVYVQGGCNDRDAVWSPGWTEAYLKPRGSVGVVVDGGVYKSFQCCTSTVPIFAKFVSPSPAINRKSSESFGKPTVVGGVTIKAGDIIMGDKDGVIVIPQENEDELFEYLDGYIYANAMFGKVAAKAIANGVAMTKEPALAAMFNRKYRRPESYWREYEGWWNEWKSKYPGIEDTVGTSAFYSGGLDDGQPPHPTSISMSAADVTAASVAAAVVGVSAPVTGHPPAPVSTPKDK